MKKFGKSLYVAALTALVLASCGKEPGQNPGGPNDQLAVVFGSNIITQPTATSRADNNAWSNRDSIGIFMLNSGKQIGEADAIIEDNINRHYQVRTEAGDPTKGKINPYNYNNVIYYPINPPVGKLKFMAYYPYTSEVDLNDYTLEVDINDNVPLITAIVDDQDWYDYKQHPQTAPVNMEFKHKMARIKINMTPGEGFTYTDLANVSVTFRNGNTTATFSLGDDDFVQSSMLPGNAKFSIIRDNEAETTTAYLVMIPNSADMDGRVLMFEHENLTGGGVTFPLEEAIPSNKHFAKGMEYTYNAVVNRSVVIIEEGDIKEWDFKGSLEGEDQGPRPAPVLEDIEAGLDLPNTYIWPDGETELRIPVTKAYAMWMFDKKMGPYVKGDGDGGLENQYLLDLLTNAEVVWADTSTLQFYSIEYDEPFEGAYLGEIILKYDAAAGGPQRPINIVVGLRNLGATSTEYLWTWHVWKTDGDPTANYESRKNYNGAYTYYFMDRNLGARNATVGNPGAKGLYYRMGLKDPFVGTYAWKGDDEDWKYVTQMWRFGDAGIQRLSQTKSNQGLHQRGDNWEDNSQKFTSPGQAVKSPMYWSQKDWWLDPLKKDTVKVLWGWAGSDRSHYDPCPEGWRVPGTATKAGSYEFKDSPWYNPTINNNGQDEQRDIHFYSSHPKTDADMGWIFDGMGTGDGNNGAAATDGDWALGYFPVTGYRKDKAEADNFNSQTRIYMSSGRELWLGRHDPKRVLARGDDENGDFGWPIRCAQWKPGKH